jgi:hypothetical protein
MHTTSLRSALASLLLLGGCTVGASLPLGGSIGYRTSPGYASAGGGDGSYVQNGGGDEEAPADPDLAGGRPACVRDRGGSSFSSAGPLGVGQNGGCVQGAKSDIFTLTAPENPGGTLYVFRMIADDQICTTIYNQDRQQLGGGECVTDNEAKDYWASLAPGSTMYVKLERTFDRASPYVIDIRSFEITDPEEPNNSWKQATPLAFGTPHEAMLAGAINDKRLGTDFYKVDVDADGVLEIVVDPQSDDVQPEVYVYDADRKQVARENADNEGAILRMRTRVPEGRYYVVLAENSPNYTPWGIDTNGARPTSHYATPYKITVDVNAGDRPSKKRVSRR